MEIHFHAEDCHCNLCIGALDSPFPSEDPQLHETPPCQFDDGCGWVRRICGDTLGACWHRTARCAYEGCSGEPLFGCHAAGSLVCGAPLCVEHTDPCPALGPGARAGFCPRHR